MISSEESNRWDRKEHLHLRMSRNLSTRFRLNQKASKSVAAEVI